MRLGKRTMSIAAHRLVSGAGWCLGFLAFYVLLEWATYRHDVSPLGITPWNPSAGLAAALLLRTGWRAAPVVAIALLIADLTVRQVDFPWWVELAEVVVTVASYTGAVLLLQQRWLDFEREITSFRDLCILMACVIAGAMIAAFGYTSVLTGAGLLSESEFVQATLRLWGGDVLGIMAVTPFVLLASARRLPRVSAEFCVQMAAVLVAVALVFSGRDGLRAELTYLLFLPVVWAAVRQGLVGVSAALLFMQISLMVALHFQPSMASINIVGLQALLLILLFAGLAIGVLTTERELLSSRLHQQELRMEQAARTASMGSFSNSLAHEVSQPLTAIANFVRTAIRALKMDTPDTQRAGVALDQAAAQVDRVVEITRKLRSLFEMGKIELAPHDAGAMAAEAVALMSKTAAEHGTVLVLERPDQPLIVSADRLQIGLVLNNLLRNAIEAAAMSASARRTINLGIQVTPQGDVAFSVRDKGPGFPPGFSLETHAVGHSSKPGGLGIGLGICRSIIEAHGGRISIAPRPDGATVAFTVPAVRGGLHA